MFLDCFFASVEAYLLLMPLESFVIAVGFHHPQELEPEKTHGRFERKTVGHREMPQNLVLYVLPPQHQIKRKIVIQCFLHSLKSALKTQ